MYLTPDKINYYYYYYLLDNTLRATRKMLLNSF